MMPRKVQSSVPGVQCLVLGVATCVGRPLPGEGQGWRLVEPIVPIVSIVFLLFVAVLQLFMQKPSFSCPRRAHFGREKGCGGGCAGPSGPSGSEKVALIDGCLLTNYKHVCNFFSKKFVGSEK